jgi:hypothetical protein
LIEEPEGKRPHGTLGVDDEIILKWILKKWGGSVMTGFICFRLRSSERLL